ncbi:ShlB/FhaC/HecB family hemolysin secretion/activation protein [Phormidium sp. FACHB-592]|nr:ShlB/FhaC/HecB family hemolysin secretion/activation protein [Phormidium sp. FACHB-592]MBD2074893.1 ShlB/FhaC/HecB family hemolysin secretion/activation protein [Phormidium sp. FACHB-592]
MQSASTTFQLGCSVLIAVSLVTAKPVKGQDVEPERSPQLLLTVPTVAKQPHPPTVLSTTVAPVSQLTIAQGIPANAAPQQLPREPSPPSTQPPPASTPAPLPPPDQLLPRPGSQPAAPFENTLETITVERFEVVGSTVFSAAEFAKITEPFTKRPLAIVELFQLRSAITQLYLDKGYITSGAYVPPQTLQRGVVTIRVIEGKLETITVSGTRRLSPNYVRSRLAIATGAPLNRDRLLTALQLLQLDPLLQSLSAELSAGTRPGESVLSVQVTEARSLNSQLTFDNARAPSVGTNRRQIQISQGNTIGLGDRLSASYTNTNGSNAIDLGYVLPLNPRNGTLSLNYGSAASSIIEPPFDVLEIESKARYYELAFRQPLVQTPTRELAVGITATHRQSEATLLDGLIPFPALGADPDGKTRLTALRFFQEATWRSGTEVIALRSQFTVGLNALSATINPDSPDSRFFAWRGQGQWVRLLAPDTLLLVRGDLQLADRPMLPLEQFGLGGQDSVRGYRQDALLTDNGLFTSAEVRFPILRLPKLNSLLQLTPFIDLGTAWNLGNAPNPDPRTLLAVGLGLRLQYSDRLTARLDWGIPLTDISGAKNTLQENGLYFSIVIRPF